MKKNILLVLLLAVCADCLAQRKTPAPAKRSQTTEALIRYLTRAGSANKTAAAKATGVPSERLIAESRYGGPDSSIFPLPDSSTYVYSSGRGSDFNYNLLDFTNSYPSYPHVYAAGLSLTDITGRRGYVAHADIGSDTSLYYGTNIDSDIISYGLQRSVYTAYNTDNTIVTYTDTSLSPSVGTLYSFYLKDYNTYDAAGNLTSALELFDNGGIWDTEYYQVFTYSGSLLIADSISGPAEGGLQVADPSYGPGVEIFLSGTNVHTYFYDAGGNLSALCDVEYNPASGLWDTAYKYIMDYFPATNQLKTVTDYEPHGDTLYRSSTDTFGWQPGVDYYTYKKIVHYRPNGRVFDHDDIYIKQVSAAGLPDTAYTYAYGGFTPAITRSTYIYDSYRQPVTSIDLFIRPSSDMNTPPDTFSHYHHYYYELYERTSAIPCTTTVTERVNVYPNPATEVVNISRPDAVKGAYTTIKLINAAGQLLRSETLPWLQDTETISLRGLAPGTYWLIVQDKDGNMLCRQAVVKQ